jgi:hypothetical protein
MKEETGGAEQSCVGTGSWIPGHAGQKGPEGNRDEPRQAVPRMKPHACTLSCLGHATEQLFGVLPSHLPLLSALLYVALSFRTPPKGSVP